MTVINLKYIDKRFSQMLINSDISVTSSKLKLCETMITGGW